MKPKSPLPKAPHPILQALKILTPVISTIVVVTYLSYSLRMEEIASTQDTHNTDVSIFHSCSPEKKIEQNSHNPVSPNQ